MRKTDPRRARDYLEHILDAVGRVRRYLDGMNLEQFLADEKTQDAVIRNLEIIGEASRNIRRRHPDFATRHADLPWDSAYEMRNALSHGYSTVDLNIVWRTAWNDLPSLERRIQELLPET